MCQIHLLTYTCNHTLPIRRSTCHGTFTTTPDLRKPPKTACSGAATLVLISAYACGDCHRRDAEAEFEDRRKRGEMAARVEGAGDGGRDHGTESYRLWKRFPSCQRYRHSSNQRVEQRRWKGVGAETGGKGESGRLGAMKEKGSLLRREVKAEEVVIGSSGGRTLVGQAWDQENWGDYKSLSDELKEDAASATEDDWTSQSTDCSMTSAMGESMEDYCAAFDTNDTVDTEYDDQEERFDTPWSSDWPTESSWPAETATDWNFPSAEETEAKPTVAQQERSQSSTEQAQSTDLPPPSPFRPSPTNPHRLAILDDITSTDHLTPQSLAFIPSPRLDFSTTNSVLTLRTRGSKTVSPPMPRFQQRKSTFDSTGRSSGGVKGDGGLGPEVELREILRCSMVVHLPLVACCGGGRCACE